MKKSQFSLLLGLFFSVIFSEVAFAQNFNDVAENISDSVESIPGIIAALSYLGGLVIAVSAIFKTVDHVTDPRQTPLAVPVIRYFIGGALFALPIIIEAAAVTINGSGAAVVFQPDTDVTTFLTSILGTVTLFTSLNNNINAVLDNIIESIEDMPALIAIVSYLLGLVISVSALYKTRDHVEDPTRVPLKDAVIRYITAGALFSLPIIFESMYTAIYDNGTGILGVLVGLVNLAGFLWSSESAGIGFSAGMACPIASGVGQIICNAMIGTIYLPVFLASISYLIGLVFGVWGIFKIRDHVIDPSRVAVSEGVTRFLAGGAFFALPFIVSVFKVSFLDTAFSSLLIIAGSAMSNTTFNSALTCSTANSLDQAMGCFMEDILGPSHVVLNFFSYVAGTIFIMIGISRLIKSSQEGARGPGGIGTFGTFVIGGLLLSATTILRAFSSSLFFSPITLTYASMQYTTGMSVAETQAAHNVISAVLQFMIIIGMLSFVRGLFIIRDVAEGSQQASTMAGMTHLIGGALAVNLGPLLNAIQSSLGITSFGVSFGL